MAYMTLEVVLPNGGLAELRGPDIKFWLGQGLPTYEGGLDGFAICHPTEFAYLLRHKYVRAIAEVADLTE